MFVSDKVDFKAKKFSTQKERSHTIIWCLFAKKWNYLKCARIWPQISKTQPKVDKPKKKN